MAWSRDPDRYRGVPRRQADRIRRRDKGICQNCGRPGHDVDHDKNVAAGGTDEDENLQVLCTECHKAKIQVEAAAGRARASRYREPEPHPGRLLRRAAGGGG
ncbi:HNH endonuclease [Nocardia sp. NPDC004573]